MRRPFPRSLVQFSTTVVLLLLFSAWTGRASAAPILTGSATVTFTGDFGGGPGSVVEADVVAVGAGPEIAFGDGSNIGTNVFLDFESIDLDGLTITYTMQGGSNVDAVQPGYGDNGMVAGEFVFSSLLFSPDSSIIGISASLTDIIDPNNVASLFSFTADSVTLAGLEQLLVLVSPQNTGTITVTLALDTETDTTTDTTGPVPEPATLSLIGLGVVAMVRRRVLRS